MTKIEFLLKLSIALSGVIGMIHTIIVYLINSRSDITILGYQSLLTLKPYLIIMAVLSLIWLVLRNFVKKKDED